MTRVLLSATAITLIALQAVAFAQPRSIRIVAERFVFTPSRIDIAAGEEVELVLESDDTSHGFRIAGAGVDIAIPKRGAGEARVRVTLDEPGRYAFECSRVCGAGHGFMRGEVVVRPPTSAGDGQ